MVRGRKGEVREKKLLWIWIKFMLIPSRGGRGSQYSAAAHVGRDSSGIAMLELPTLVRVLRSMLSSECHSSCILYRCFIAGLETD